MLALFLKHDGYLEEGEVPWWFDDCECGENEVEGANDLC